IFRGENDLIVVKIHNALHRHADQVVDLCVFHDYLRVLSDFFLSSKSPTMKIKTGCSRRKSMNAISSSRLSLLTNASIAHPLVPHQDFEHARETLRERTVISSQGLELPDQLLIVHLREAFPVLGTAFVCVHHCRASSSLVSRSSSVRRILRFSGSCSVSSIRRVRSSR